MTFLQGGPKFEVTPLHVFRDRRVVLYFLFYVLLQLLVATCRCNITVCFIVLVISPLEQGHCWFVCRWNIAN